MTTPQTAPAQTRSTEVSRVWRRFIAEASRPSTVFFLGSLVVGLALRIWLTYSATFTLDSDTAVVYLMSRHVTHGEFAGIFWGQQYGGTALQIVAGLVMVLTGTSWRVVAIVSALFFLAATIVLRQIAVRALGVVWGDLAGILMWFPLAVSTQRTVTDPGFYGPSLLFGLLVLHVALSPTRRERSVASWVALGAFAGLALWTSPASVALAAPGVVLALWSDRRWTRWVVAAAAGVVTASPWLIQTLKDHGKTVAVRTFHPESFASLFTALIPASVPFGTTDESIAFVVSVLSLIAVVGPVWYGIARREATSLLLSVGTILLITSLVLGSGVRLASDSVRYVTLLVPELAFATALLLSRWRRTWLMPMVAALAIALTFATVRSHGGFHRSQSGPFDPSLVPVAAFLEENKVEHAYGSYWLAYPLTALTEEKVTVAPTLVRRYVPYETEAAAERPMAVVVYTDLATDVMLRTTPGLPPATRQPIGGYTVYLFAGGFDIYSLPVGLF